MLMPVLLWGRLLQNLHRRGQQRRESGAFLLGIRGERQEKVKAFALYDDLDPHALDTGIVVFRSNGYAALWKLCRQRRLTVLGDIHTHPGPNPRQSEADRTNPMIPEAGHMAFILPHYAGTWGWRFRDVAIYEYAGDYGWRSWSGDQRVRRVRFCLW